MNSARSGVGASAGDQVRTPDRQQFIPTLDHVQADDDRVLRALAEPLTAQGDAA